MMIRIAKLFIAVVSTSALIACATSPAPWSKELLFHARCGMSVSDVERNIGRELRDESRGGTVKDERGTHVAESSDHRTVAWFVFTENKLQGFRVGWSEALVGYGNVYRTPQVDLCSSSSH